MPLDLSPGRATCGLANGLLVSLPAQRNLRSRSRPRGIWYGIVFEWLGKATGRAGCGVHSRSGGHQRHVQFGTAGVQAVVDAVDGPVGPPDVEALGAELDVTFSTGHGLIELSAPGVTKGTGLAGVATELGVPPADVVAFGDMPNDLPMLQWAGWGVAMANAHPGVLATADEITAPNSEDGLALVLERWF